MPEALRTPQIEDEQHTTHQGEWKGQVVRHLRHVAVPLAAHQLDERRHKVQPCGQAADKEVPDKPPFPCRCNGYTRHQSCSSPRRRNETRAASPIRMALPRLTSDDARTERDGNWGLRG